MSLITNTFILKHSVVFLVLDTVSESGSDFIDFIKAPLLNKSSFIKFPFSNRENFQRCTVDSGIPSLFTTRHLLDDQDFTVVVNAGLLKVLGKKMSEMYLHQVSLLVRFGVRYSENCFASDVDDAVMRKIDMVLVATYGGKMYRNFLYLLSLTEGLFVDKGGYFTSWWKARKLNKTHALSRRAAVSMVS